MKTLNRMFTLFVIILLGVTSCQADSLIDRFALAKSGFITADEAAKLVMETIEQEYSELFKVVSIDYNEYRLVVYVESDGLANELKTAYEKGYDENYPPWVKYKEGFCDAYNFIADELAEHGRSDISFEIWLYNDDTLEGKRSPFIRYLAYSLSRGYVYDEALWRYEDYEQDIYELPEDVRPICTYIKEKLETIGFDYISLFYNELNKLFVVEVAINEVGENLYTAKQAGKNESYPPWIELKDYLCEVYYSLIDYLDEIERNDISVSFDFVNDEVHIRGYYDRINFDPLFSISNLVVKTGYVTWDIMKSY